MTIRAIFEDGVFRPLDPVDLPEHTTVEFDLRPSGSPLPPDVAAARLRLREFIVHSPTAVLGSDNEQIDADIMDRPIN